jgi:hypothetical protein
MLTLPRGHLRRHANIIPGPNLNLARIINRPRIPLPKLRIRDVVGRQDVGGDHRVAHVADKLKRLAGGDDAAHDGCGQGGRRQLGARGGLPGEDVALDVGADGNAG